MDSVAKDLGKDSTAGFYVESDFLVTVDYDAPWDRKPHDNHEFLSTMLAPIYEKPICPFCGQQLKRQTSKDLPPTTDFSSVVDQSIFGFGRKAAHTTDLFICEHCGWWVVHQGFVSATSATDLADSVHWAKLKQFDIGKAEVPIEHLRDYLGKNPDKLYGISPRSFEKLMADCLRDFFDCEVRHVGGPNDGGTDIILIISNEPILVQVKRRSSPHRVEGVSVVREILGSLLSQGVSQGIVISTAKRFSKEAVRNVELPVITSRGYAVSLYSYKEVLDLLTSKRKAEFAPWRTLWPTDSDIAGLM